MDMRRLLLIPLLAFSLTPGTAQTRMEDADARARGVNIILGLGVNIFRFPRNSCNFEYLGEDPGITSGSARRRKTFS